LIETRPAAPKVARARSSDAGEITYKPMLIGYARVPTVDGSEHYLLGDPA
jgi:hypothetical protein